MKPARALICSLLAAMATPAAAQHASPTPDHWIRAIGSARLRGEGWNWFPAAAPSDGSYPLGSGYLRFGVAAGWRAFEVQAEGEAPFLIGVPTDAVAPAPGGQLGFGGTARATNGNSSTDLFLKQGYARVKSGGARPWWFRAGRFEFGEGKEALPADPTLLAIRQERVAERLIGSFGFSPVGRSFDGGDLSGPLGGGTLTFMATRPTAGVFQLNGMPELPVDLLYGSWVRPPHLVHGAAHDEARLFGSYYADRRDVGKTDNRPAAIRTADRERIRITTLGGHYLASGPAAGGRADLLLWGAWQSGDWGRLRHRAWAAAAEVGYRPGTSVRNPWIRLGVFQSSGDKDAADGTHGTFFQLLPTPRPYARFPFYNLMNLTEAFASLRLSPHPALSLRSDVHVLRLTRRTDLWYSGGGAFDEKVFGYAGRGSGGALALARLLDVSADLRLSPHTTITAYAARAFGGEVVGASYPSGRSASYVYLELSHRR
ncbi:MAG: alginate export family protein [Gemmatimonadales bacterium]